MADLTGPISSLPGAAHPVPRGIVCDNHNSRPAVARIQGETDSFGAELHDLCAECLAEHRAAIAAADTSGRCDWCKREVEKRFPAKDHEEGLAGRVYDVCQGCIDARNKRLREELEGEEW